MLQTLGSSLNKNPAQSQTVQGSDQLSSGPESISGRQVRFSSGFRRSRSVLGGRGSANGRTAGSGSTVGGATGAATTAVAGIPRTETPRGRGTAGRLRSAGAATGGLDASRSTGAGASVAARSTAAWGAATGCTTGLIAAVSLVAIPLALVPAGFSVAAGDHKAHCHGSGQKHHSSHHGRHSSELVWNI